MDGEIVNQLDQKLLELCDLDAYKPDEIRALLEQGADPNVIEITRGRARAPMLNRLITRRNPDVEASLVAFFIDSGAVPDPKNGEKAITPLIVAASYGLRDVCEVLLDAGADPNHVSEDFYDTTPLHVALIDRPAHLLTARLLLERGADPNQVVGDTTAPLVAAKNNNLAALELFDALGVDINLTASAAEGVLLPRAPLTQAVGTHAGLGCVRWLLEHGASVNEVDGSGDTPLSRALHAGNQEALSLLVEAGADLDLCFGEEDQTALCKYLAWSRCSLEVVTALLRVGADPNVADRSGHTPLWWAVTHKRLELVEALLAHGADPSARTEDGQTPLTLAAENALDVILARLRGGFPVYPRENPVAFALSLLEQQERLAFADRVLFRRGARFFQEAPGWYDRRGFSKAYATEALGLYLLSEDAIGASLRALLDDRLEEAGQLPYDRESDELARYLERASPDFFQRLQIEERPEDAARLMMEHLAAGHDFFESDHEGTRCWRLAEDGSGVVYEVAGYEGQHRSDYTHAAALEHFAAFFSQWDAANKICSATSPYILEALDLLGETTLRTWLQRQRSA